MSDTIEEGGSLAGEYVLGVLDGAEMRAISARAALDPVLAGDIAAWESRLAPLALLVTPVVPPAALWMRIARSIGPVAANSNIRSLRAWQAGTALSLALAGGLAVVALMPRGTPPVSVAALAPLGGPGAAFLVRSLPNGSLQVAALAPGTVPTGRDLELWALPSGATKPVSLGVLPVGGRVLQASALTAPGGKILVSLEPKGGSPTGQPTGPVLYGGTITQL